MALVAVKQEKNFVMHRAYETGSASLHASCRVRMDLSEYNDEGGVDERTEIVATTVGRALLSGLLPYGLPFALINQVLNKRSISRLFDTCYRVVGLKDTVIFADRLMYTGFQHATR